MTFDKGFPTPLISGVLIDFEYLIGLEPVANWFFTQRLELFDSWLKFFTKTQYAAAQVRQTNIHVVHESKAWLKALNFSLRLRWTWKKLMEGMVECIKGT